MTCFNEAPIHESGKWHWSICTRTAMSSFNEAPIHESGKYIRLGPDDAIEPASMRPRFMNRGSYVDKREITYKLSVLQ